ncbi:MAG: xanthine dehydrogenase family protein subunit M [Bradyrhizobiaceae bacterium]|nr:xanthine dehydrogenase family protein subunit M [Bradyrhizobiaceae bacterium]
MIPGPFTYHRPSSVRDAVALLAALGDDARPLAGGHSLIPMMKLRMAAPEHLVDLAGISELKDIAEDGGTIVIGAGVTLAALIRSQMLAARLPVMRETALVIADPQVRYKGTIGGNVANGDPGNDMPALMQALGAHYVLSGTAGERRVAARDFYRGTYDTALAAGEIVAAIRIPVPPAGSAAAYEKLKRKIGDYATAAAAVALTMVGDSVTNCAIALTNVANRPLFAEAASAAAVGTTLDPATVRTVAEAAVAITSPAADRRGSAEYRRAMAGIMVTRALLKAASRAKGL